MVNTHVTTKGHNHQKTIGETGTTTKGEDLATTIITILIAK
jgi:hypothetical protein